MENISIDEARAIAAASQGLTRASDSIESLFRHVGCLQIDPIRAVRESHELVALARGISLAQAKTLFSKGSAFPVFSFPIHALALLPLCDWPYVRYLHAAYIDYGWRGPPVNPAAVGRVRDIVRERAAATVADFSDKKGAGWNRSSELRIAAEWLTWTGELICAERIGSKRLYKCAESVVPASIMSMRPSMIDSIDYWVRRALQCLGVATVDDVADYFRMPKSKALESLRRQTMPMLRVEGWEEPVWHAPEIDTLSFPSRKFTALSPFDSLIWTRKRLERLYGKSYRLEAYKAAGDRVFGHYFMGIYWRHKIVGRVAVSRQNSAISINNAEFDSDAPDELLAGVHDLLKSWTSA